MFSKTANYTKMKTNLRLVVNRLKLLEKKKTEMALKARKEIADYIQAGKDDRARIRVEHIIREDYLVEAMEMIEMYCDLLLARFGLISSQKELDPGLEEAISTIIWITPRLQADVAELRSVTEQLTVKYSKEFAQACLKNEMSNVSEKVMHKMSVQAPPKILVERYMMEIAKSYNVPFSPDPMIMKEDELNGIPDLVDIDPPYNKSGGGSGGGGGGRTESFPSVPPSSAPVPPLAPPSGQLPYPSPQTGYPSSQFSSNTAGSYPSPSSHPGYPSGSQSQATGGVDQPPPYTPNPANLSAAGPLPSKDSSQNLNLPELPNVPSSPASSVQPGAPSDEVDFDDLSRRFEELKKRK